MSLFSKKKKVEVKHEDAKEVHVHIEIRPLVKIEKHEKRVDGKVQEPKYRISIADRDVLTLSQTEYDEVFMAMLHRKDSQELIHDIAEVHMAQHGKVDMGAVGSLGEAIAKAMEVAKKQ